MSTKKSKTSGGYLSATSYGGFRCSLTNMYRMSGKTMDGELNKEIYQFMLVMKRVFASNKREYGAIINEGRKAMSFVVYKRFQCK